jgi:hypothetical protein
MSFERLLRGKKKITDGESNWINVYSILDLHFLIYNSTKELLFNSMANLRFPWTIIHRQLGIRKWVTYLYKFYNSSLKKQKIV